VHGETAVTEMLVRGIHDGVLDLPGLEPLPPTGRRARLLLRETITVRHGLVVRVRMDFDPAEIRRALEL
jgi:hypothetical protein